MGNPFFNAIVAWWNSLIGRFRSPKEVRQLRKALNLENIKKVMKNKGYQFFENGSFNLNIIGVRSDIIDADRFDDFLTVTYKDEHDKWVCKVYIVTTDPGKQALLNPVNAKGTAILVPNQYRGSWEIGVHAGKYEALVQTGPVKVWRDGNRDLRLDMKGTMDEGVFGINIHRAGHVGNASEIGKYSAGCTVFQFPDDFNEFMQLCRRASKSWGAKFTYTLLTAKDFRDAGLM